jgi:uncharacterized protein
MEQFNKVLVISTARRAIDEYFKNQKKIIIDDITDFPDEVQEKKGLFVSLKKWPEYDFRGSSGIISSDKSIIETVIDKTIASVRHDSIFPMMKDDTVDKLVIQINILKKYKEIEFPYTLKENEAIVVSIGNHTGFFLSELPLMVKWDFEETVSQLCLKSGLPGNVWKDKRCKIYAYECESFTEKEPGSFEIV